MYALNKYMGRPSAIFVRSVLPGRAVLGSRDEALLFDTRKEALAIARVLSRGLPFNRRYVTQEII